MHEKNCTIILLKLIYELNEIPIKFLMGFVWNLIIEFLSSPEGEKTITIHTKQISEKTTENFLKRAIRR